MSFGVLYDKIGNLVEKHGAEVILLQKVVCCQPGVLGHVVRQLHGRPSLVHVDGEDVVILLRGDQESQMTFLMQTVFLLSSLSLWSYLSFVHYTLRGLLV